MIGFSNGHAEGVRSVKPRFHLAPLSQVHVLYMQYMCALQGRIKDKWTGEQRVGCQHLLISTRSFL